MLFPRPVSARKLVRLNIAKTIGGIGGLYKLVVSKVEEQAELDIQGGQTGAVNTVARIGSLRGPFLRVFVSNTCPQQY